MVLVLQGGGALGAYQFGAYEALHQAGIGANSAESMTVGLELHRGAFSVESAILQPMSGRGRCPLDEHLCGGVVIG